MELLDKLAQSGTDDIIINRATGLDDRNALWKRARAKHFGDLITLRQINSVKNSVLTDSYWNTYYCNSMLVENPDGTIKSRYCKNRWCPVCNRIRTAQNIHKYLKIVEAWPDPYFVTLTKPTVSDFELFSEIANRQSLIRKIVQTIKKRRSRSADENIRGIRKIEVAYNFYSDKYHPHYHLLVASKADASELLELWLLNNPTANEDAQDMREAYKNSLLEIFKYVTKLTGRNKHGNVALYPPLVLDNIFTALKGIRTFQSFGFRGLPTPLPSELTKDDMDKADALIWEWHDYDWICRNTGEYLTGYEPSDNINNIIKASNYF